MTSFGRGHKCSQLAFGLMVVGLATLLAIPLLASDVVPHVIDQPGSQPGEAAPDSGRCENCHGGSYDPAVEPGFNWRGSMMSHATRDPIFWATVDVAEQDFIPNLAVWNLLNPDTPPGTDPPGGVGDLCIRCHTIEGWIGGRSTPTDGTGLSPSSDFDGVSCDSCHRMMDPATAEARRTLTPGNENYWVNDQGEIEAFYGSGQYILDPGGDKRGPYDDAEARSHGPIPDLFFRSGDFCGTCHDVSNMAVGQFAPNHGRLDDTPLPLNFCGITRTECVDDSACADCQANQEVCETTCAGEWDAALTPSCDRHDTCRTTMAEAYPPYMYGIVERTYSEWKGSAWRDMATAGFMDDPAIPEDLKVLGGAPEVASRNEPYNSSTDRIYNPERMFTCQSCHMPSVTGQGCNKDPEVRTDMPLHDLTGGSTWMPEAMKDMSDAGTLFGGALPADQVLALDAGVTRARALLQQSIKVDTINTPPGGLSVRITNLTGHKFLSGYPEGRRAWINVLWFDDQNTLIHEDGGYDPVEAELDGKSTRVYKAHPGMSRDWAGVLLSVGYEPIHALDFDQEGNVTATLGDLASGALGETIETFHFVLNNVMLEDHRIPPYGFDPTVAALRNTLPVPADTYPVLPDGKLQHWDDVVLPVPVGANRAEVQVFYQSTSREYVDFLRFANTTTDRGETFYQAWLNTGMSPPEPLLAPGGNPTTVPWAVPACDGAPGPVGDTLTATLGVPLSGTQLSWAEVADATGYLIHRWLSADRSGEDSVHDVAQTHFGDDDLPVPDSIFYYEVGSTTACGETVGEFAADVPFATVAAR